MNSLKQAEKYAKLNAGKAKSSKLDPHIEAIKFLLQEKDFTLLQIQEFLKTEIKLSVSYSNLQGFVKRRFKNNSEAVTTPAEKEKKETKKITAESESESESKSGNPILDAMNKRKKELKEESKKYERPFNFKVEKGI